MSANSRPSAALARFRLLAFLTGAAPLAVAFGQLPGLHGYWLSAHEVIGADFSTFWSAARLALAGQAATAFDIHGFDLAQKSMLGAGREFAFWSYPPPSLILYLPFARLPYLQAYLSWMAVSFAVLALWARKRLGSWREAALLLVCPAIAFDVLAGQNGLLTAVVLLAGLSLTDRKPWLAGAVLGLLVLKPQLGLFLPVAVIAGGRWRMMGGALASGLVLVLASVLLFGLEPWRGFVTATLPMQSAALRQGTGWFQLCMPTAFMAARLAGAPWQVGVAAQIPFVLLGAGLVWRTWRSEADLEQKTIVLVLASAAATPQLFTYDMVAYSAAILLWVRRDPSRDNCNYALAGWAAPLVSVAMGAAHLPLAPVLIAAVAWRAAHPRPSAPDAKAVPRPAGLRRIAEAVRGRALPPRPSPG